MRVRRWVELGAWVSGIALLVFYGSSRLWAESERLRGLDEWRASTQAGGAERLESAERRSPAAFDQSLWSDQRIRAFAEAAARPGVPSGALRVPSIGLEVPIYAGTSELNLNRGAAHIEGTAPLGANGNVGLAAHRDGFFRRLGALRLDSEVILEVGSRRLVYRVTDIRIVEPADVHVLAPTSTPAVTLVTCYPFYFAGSAPERYIVRAELFDSNDGQAFLGDRRMSLQKPITEGAEP